MVKEAKPKHSPPRRGGVARSAGVVSSTAAFRRSSIGASPCRARASRHPVCAFASLGASSPPLRGGECVVAILLVLCLLAPSTAHAQARGGRGGPPPTAKAAAPIDLTGYWTAVITEDWHQRMLTAPRGDFGTGANGAVRDPGGAPVGVGPNPSDQGNIPYKVEGAQAAMKWDPAKDEAEGNVCKAYGAIGIMRQPTHLHITWQADNTLKVEADSGTQTRLFHFGPPPRPGQMNYVAGRYVPAENLKIDVPAGTPSSLQGYSVAAWTAMGGRGNFERSGYLKVVTTQLTPGYYWKNGVPYTGNAVLTEHFRLMQLPDGSEWLLLSQLVEDPEYLNQPYLVNYQFKKLPDGAKWNPTPCSAR